MPGDIAPIEQTYLEGDTQKEQTSPVANTEDKERVLPSLLPRISRFPERVRPVVNEAYLKGKKKSEESTILMKGISGVMNKLGAKDLEKDDILKQSEEETPESKEKAVRAFEVVKKEFLLLHQAYLNISQGKDAPQLRDIPSPFAQEMGVSRGFSDEELQRFGKPKNIINAGRQIFARMDSDYNRGSIDFREKMTRLFDDRAGVLLSHGLKPKEIFPNIDSTSFDLSHYPNKLSLEEQGPRIEEKIDIFYETVRNLAPNISASSQFIELLKSWVTQNGGLLDTVILSGGSKLGAVVAERIKRNEQSFTKETKDYKDWVQNGPKFMAREYSQRAGKKVSDLVYEIGQLAFPIRGHDILQDASMSQDYLDLLQSLQLQILEVQEVTRQQGLFTISQFVEENLKGLISTSEYAARLDQKLGESRELLYHATPYESFKDILRRGALASRKYQQDHFGESNFSSGMMKVGADYVEVPDYYGYPKRMTKEEYAKQYTSGARKKPDQEAHQVCFSLEYPYMYYQGVSFVFSQSSLFSESQFMSQDGWHLFPKNYSSYSKDAPGFSVDLTKEPMMMVISEELKDDFKNFVQTELVQQPAWGIKNVDEWMGTHTVIVPASKQQEFTEDMVDNVHSKFWENNRVDKKVGWIVPTGEKGQTATHDYAPLFTYQQEP